MTEMHSENKFIIFTDLKNFTYKNSLLTDRQISQILDTFTRIVEGSAKQFGVTVVKSIGDAFFCVAESIQEACGFSQEIIAQSLDFDTKQKIDLHKISLRVTITYGHVAQNTVLNLEDYFGEAINLGSRIMDITPESKVFCSKEVYEQLSNQSEITFVGEFNFHGILLPVRVYSISPITQEEIVVLQESQDSRIAKAEDIVFRASCVAAVLSVQPIPFLDNVHIVAVHLYMILKISEIFGKKISLKESSEIFSAIIAPLGIGYVAFQGTAVAAKVMLPGFGGLLFAPVSFAFSYALGKVYILSFYYDACGEKLTGEDIREVFSHQKKVGKDIAKRRKKDILVVGKKYAKEVMQIKKRSNFEKVQSETLSMLHKKNN